MDPYWSFDVGRFGTPPMKSRNFLIANHKPIAKGDDSIGVSGDLI
jgi:hypothetical protein